MPKGIYIRKPYTEEHRRHMSESKKGKKPKNLEYLHSLPKELEIKRGLAISKAKKGVPINFKAELNPKWKGDKVGYNALHTWLYRELGQPRTCEHCGRTGLKGHKIQWANKSGKYFRDLTDWLRLCVPCHRDYDAKLSLI